MLRRCTETPSASRALLRISPTASNVSRSLASTESVSSITNSKLDIGNRQILLEADERAPIGERHELNTRPVLEQSTRRDHDDGAGAKRLELRGCLRGLADEWFREANDCATQIVVNRPKRGDDVFGQGELHDPGRPGEFRRSSASHASSRSRSEGRHHLPLFMEKDRTQPDCSAWKSGPLSARRSEASGTRTARGDGPSPFAIRMLVDSGGDVHRSSASRVALQ